jgi:hypothetical protein
VKQPPTSIAHVSKTLERCMASPVYFAASPAQANASARVRHQPLG